MIIFTATLIIILAYFLGSISGSILICKTLHFKDPRQHGSKNPGTTNILRIINYKIAIFVLLFDSLKGAVPIWLGTYFHIDPIYLYIIAISACIGHIYPIYFQFYGGKGVATAFGALTAISINFFIIIIITWILTVYLFRYASLGSIVTFIVITFYVWYIQYHHFEYIILLSLIILSQHKNNIKRLWNHQEKHIWNR
ncbi:putative inner membrane protein [Candidatus Blochmanniella floridana]|uniref:Glycerol-3-phosphate acyltransferase n=1 Tax=Blochmanniella floridana TaxID=203907 RepID=PLSY_BLOFL|nr:RecName: Full=Glycerol-3-phosphate acyltransferase; AltName: Full=Acyl-PO4 G3P acyltransferase; AltName: Full=Acyl-phosphate--glycerol-3-phosphate acyltransferase; AltName: Full=G3P acyltransferase; Short=GPAT; AltName: Full=Lysophosphatidic acid synthase; Short=LPA synthase [Candidatus Blochmannia floridanus]CAD83585.1 putative inner membrane protein [Candidatus Blochmannia floridanus]